MGKVLMFNRNADSLDQLWLDEDQHRNTIQELEQKGWYMNPPLVHLHNPQHKIDKIVHVDDASYWEERGFYRDPTWVYHPTEGTKMVPREEAKKLMNGGGWYSNPRFFPGNAGSEEAQVLRKMRGKDVA